jgi:hypothetical protein
MPAPSPEEIHALLAEAFSNGDLDAFVEMHEVDAMTIVPPDGRQANGRNEIREALEPVFALRPRVTNEVLKKLEKRRPGAHPGPLELRRHPPRGRARGDGGRGDHCLPATVGWDLAIVMENPIRPRPDRTRRVSRLRDEFAGDLES